MTITLTKEEFGEVSRALDYYELQRFKRDESKRELIRDMSRYAWRVKSSLYKDTQ